MRRLRPKSSSQARRASNSSVETDSGDEHELNAYITDENHLGLVEPSDPTFMEMLNDLDLCALFEDQLKRELILNFEYHLLLYLYFLLLYLYLNYCP